MQKSRKITIPSKVSWLGLLTFFSRNHQANETDTNPKSQVLEGCDIFPIQKLIHSVQLLANHPHKAGKRATTPEKKWHSHLSRQKLKISFRKCVYRCLRIRERARHPVRQHFIGINFEGALLPGQHHRGHKKEHLTGVDRSWALPPGCDAELFYMHLDLSFFCRIGLFFGSRKGHPDVPSGSCLFCSNCAVSANDPLLINITMDHWQGSSSYAT